MSAEFWKNTAPNITLDFWDKTNDDNEVTLVFQKGVEELLQNSIVARASVQHDRKAKERKKPIKPSDVAKTKDHLQESFSWGFEVFDNPDTTYGMTKPKKRGRPPKITIADAFCIPPKRLVEKNAKAFVAMVTLVHERLHSKNLQDGTGDSPTKIFPSPCSQKGESGDFFECQVFGGVISSLNGATDFSQGVGITYETPQKTITRTIEKNWIACFISKVVSRGRLLKKTDLKVPRNGKIVKNATRRTKTDPNQTWWSYPKMSGVGPGGVKY
eukprot:TRINITY_DN6926_c0_g1_i3.p1 TRINITY_DN6926_c0_g1~~TRINITY_DN6926_c0_g1_i3.p1  ORF type:complete len:271 (-),score=39.70 TRINITY_DN6926_c0_g1_i3:42-854(-)